MATSYSYDPRARAPQPPSLPLGWQILAAALGGVGLFVVAILALLLALNFAFAGKVYPGVSMGGVKLSGLTLPEAETALAQKMSFPTTGKIVITGADQTWIVRPADLGVSIDAAANAQAAFAYGRTGGWLRSLLDQLRGWQSGASISPVLVYQERLAQDYLANLATLIDRPTVEAALSVNGSTVSAVPGQIGRKVDLNASMAALQNQIAQLQDGQVALVIVESAPEIMDVSVQAETARRYLAAPLTLSLPAPQPGDPGPWTIPVEQLAGMLEVRKVQAQGGSTYQVGLKEDALNTYLSALAGQVNHSPENTRFTFNDDTRQLEVIKPAVIGRTLDIFRTIQDIQTKLAAGEHALTVTVATTQPEVTDDATGEKLGIREEIMAYTSYFRGSTAERLQNIEKAAANFHGLLVAPGATFSMASAMENVTLDNGYAEAWIIYGGKTIKGVGGGVCQVSTTLFRAAFFAGFPIVERHSHAYRVGYYEQTASGHDAQMAGMDATVFLPMVDFKFQNDTPYWLLMETYYYPNSRSLLWKFYSTSDGRKVEWETSGPQNVEDPPEPQYEENPDLAQGQIVQVDWAAEGADVTVLRTVYRDGVALFTDSFITHYLPWADVFQYGPGTQLPNTNKPKPGTFINP
jgi:vancomycin resistance protein YoaR